MTRWRQGQSVPQPREAEWRPVVGYEGRYEVSDQGQVRSLVGPAPRILSASWGRYPTVSLGRKNKRRVHHLVLEAFVGPRPSGMEARHADDVSTNNSASNLSWGTSSENRLDAVRNRRHFQTRQTCCKRGHRLERPNLIASKLEVGHRACLACDKAHGEVANALARHGRVLDLSECANRHYAKIMGVAP